MSNTKGALDELRASIRADLLRADKHVVDLTTWASKQPEGYETLAAALLLHHLYGAIEAIIERSLKLFDGSNPHGQDWHMRLLESASRELPEVRPIILPQNDTVDELRRFRHRLRKRYDVDTVPERLHPVIQSAITSWPKIRVHLVRFVDFVDECAQGAE